jgi:thymidylate synthase (FAD)
MHKTTPQVFLVARPSLNWEGIKAYLDLVGGQEHFDRMRSAEHALPFRHAGSQLVEFMGRLCYRSWKEGLNPNVTKIREDRTAYLANVLNSKHGSVLEHANYSFVLANVSRVFTHELVRHRVGTAFARKKTVTSAMRRYAPDGLSTHIGFTANVRALRWLCQQRTEPSAEVEIRKVFNLVGQTMCIEEPELFQDFIVDEDGAWVPANRKV